MPATDALPNVDAQEPPLTKTEREICKAYGGWGSFMQSMGLKPWESDDAEEGKAIIAAFASDKEEEDKTANKTSNANSGAGRG
ncbi:hypothetical protein MAC_07798 [Metarhizium acridum CQMa 102]|uniref:Extracellular metalloproteinase 3 n=1 Tax=Metarhizium acridum (strain CQMa 102) TaxID=655827 RepID=E9ED50_METAQ|nr:uncharacterized protein MAC_07798 [Metarhizium acridum CQMa 102]EFY86133.1 hypothetical protein MAC_07798 [Metarhizium acridum CQMa 102]